MATLNEDILDAQVTHRVSLLHYENDTVQRIIRILNAVDADLVAEILRRDPTAVTGAWSRRRLEELLEAVRRINAEAYRQVNKVMGGEIVALAAAEAAFQVGALAQGVVQIGFDVVKPAAQQLAAAALANPMQGRLLKEWTDGLSAAASGRIRDALRMGFVAGETVEQMVQRIKGTRANQFRDGVQEISRRGARVFVQTAIAETAHFAREMVYKENADLIDRIQWVATLDTHTCPRCMALDGETFALAEGPRPPLHFNCFPGDALVTTSSRVRAASKRWFDGEIIVARTSSGREFTCTPNHPILTPRGWTPAQALNLGSKVVCDLRRQRPTGADRHHYDVPARIHDIASAFFASRAVRAEPMPISAEHFHGDGIGSQVAVIGTDRFLRRHFHPAPREHGLQLAFNGSLRPNHCLSCSCLLASNIEANFYATNRVMRGAGEALSFVFGRLRHAAEHGLGAIARRDSVVTQDPLNGTTRDAERICERLHAGAGDVVADDIVFIERRIFSGHVYNLETEDSLIMADGVVTHNCRCTTTPVTKSFRDLGIDEDEVPGGTRASMNGQVPQKTTYNEWLKRQPAGVQDMALGPARGQLYRAGRLDVKDFQQDFSRTLTLAELARREAAAFSRAGLTLTGNRVSKLSASPTPASDLYARATATRQPTADQIIAKSGAAARVKEVEANLKNLVPTNAPVEQGGFLRPDKTYTPARQKLHESILDKIFTNEAVRAARAAPGTKPTLYVLGGRGGSGKSFITSAGGPVNKSKALLLDADHIKGQLPEYKGWNAGQLHEESSYILELADKRATALRLNTIHDATMKSEATAATRIVNYKLTGYDVEGYYVFAPPAVAAQRSIERFVRGMEKDGKGRYVPPSIILGNVRNEANFDKLKGGFKKWQVWDNSGTRPKLFAEGENDL